MRRAQIVEQPVQRGCMTHVEQLELWHHPELFGPGIELADERPRVGEHLRAEVHRPAGNRARVRAGVEDGEPLLEAVGDGSAGG